MIQWLSKNFLTISSKFKSQETLPHKLVIKNKLQANLKSNMKISRLINPMVGFLKTPKAQRTFIKSLLVSLTKVMARQESKRISYPKTSSRMIKTL